MSRWASYVVTLGFAVYWASNLFLWFPWSYSAMLGMTLMLTVSPILWGYVTFLCLRTFPGQSLMGAELSIAAIFGVMAVAMDYIFFGLIRDAMEQLYHPTTFYGYGFLVCLPFIVGLIFRGRIRQSGRAPTGVDFAVAGSSGILCFGMLALIIVFGLEI